ncbi:MAG: UDP-2,3-diacetamido-2,3-dideoxy-D-glucuronate 2-epimerase [Gammaproteobacteria bacterium]|nr:MAG: UDP-2,3-diacetamido-2,3-dideoxy-D-glucuronate 2-epimerase [Gammaproteobacteria bacterium]
MNAPVLMQVVGARPQFIKLAPLSREIARRRLAGRPYRECVVHTGQHYDDAMSAVFFEQLSLPRPTHDLGVGSGPHGAQTAAMLAGLESVIEAERPAAVIVYGDTNSTLAAAFAAAKRHVPVVHVEAGLRSGNRRMPEEINRIAVDHIADLLLAPTASALDNLVREGRAAAARWTGDVMYDAVSFTRRLLSGVARPAGVPEGDYLLATVHRAENTDDPHRLAAIVEALATLAETALPVVWPLHPRTRAALERLGRPLDEPGLMLFEPVGYLELLALLDGARLVLTDSGGVQKEAFFFDTPCLTLRDETEWPETVAAGANRLVGADAARIVELARHTLGLPPVRYDHGAFGDGEAAARCLDEIEALLNL